MIDQGTTIPAPSIPRDTFEGYLHYAFVDAALQRWVGTPGLGDVTIDLRFHASGVWAFRITKSVAFDLTHILAPPPGVEGFCWLAPHPDTDQPRVWWRLPAQPGLPLDEEQLNYAPYPPVIVWEDVPEWGL